MNENLGWTIFGVSLCGVLATLILALNFSAPSAPRTYNMSPEEAIAAHQAWAEATVSFYENQ